MSVNLNMKRWGVIAALVINIILFYPQRESLISIYTTIPSNGEANTAVALSTLPWVVNISIILGGLFARKHRFVLGYMITLGTAMVAPFIGAILFVTGCFLFLGSAAAVSTSEAPSTVVPEGILFGCILTPLLIILCIGIIIYVLSFMNRPK